MFPKFNRKVRLWATARYGRVLPWWLRWCLPKERPMLLFVGRRGQGKTAVATHVATGRMRAGERVYANYDIQDDAEGLRAGRIFSLLDCLDLSDATVVIDEANMWTNSRMWQKVPPQILEAWQESRKSGLSFIFTSQHESRCDLVIRELVDYIMVCERVPFIPKWVPFFRVRRTHLEDVNEVRRSGLAPAEYFWLKRWVLASYDTQERLGGAKVKAMRDYQDAVRRGEDISELAVRLPERREPTRRHDGWWVNQVIGCVSADALASEREQPRVCVLPLAGCVVIDANDQLRDYADWRGLFSQAA